MTTPNIDYSSRDFDSIVAQLTTYVQAKFPNDWNDFANSQLGMAWLQLMAFTFDSLSYQLDVVANEIFRDTARDRESMILIGGLVGYKLRSATSASVSLTASIATVQAVNTIIPSGTLINTINNVVFEFTEDQIIPAGLTSALVTASQGQTLVDTFRSDGSEFQEFKLSQPEVIDLSLKVLVNNSLWSEVDSLVYSTNVDQSYSVRLDNNSFSYIKFGNNLSGLIPPLNSIISISYRVGGGVLGNISIKDINQFRIDGTLFGSSPTNFIPVLLTNDERGSGGENREDIEHARFFIPRFVQANSRAVTVKDFDTLASLFKHPIYGSPAAAKSRLHQRIPENNRVDVFLWSRDNLGNISLPSTNLITAVQDYFNNDGPGAVRIITTNVVALAGNLLYIDIASTIVSDGTLPPSTVSDNARNSLLSYFSSPTNQPGTTLRISRLYTLLQNTQGVAHATIDAVTASYINSEVIGNSNGINAVWDYTAFNLPLPSSVTITAGSYIITDDGLGNLIGNVDANSVSTVDYASGFFHFTFQDPPPPNGTPISVSYRYALDYLRSEQNMPMIINGVNARFKSRTKYSPIFHNTLAFTDGSQVVTDLGNGTFQGDIDNTKPNTVDYSTGSFDFTFKFPPNIHQSISSTYRQLLSLNHGDIPISEDQYCIPSIIYTLLDISDSI